MARSRDSAIQKFFWILVSLLGGAIISWVALFFEMRGAFTSLQKEVSGLREDLKDSKTGYDKSINELFTFKGTVEEFMKNAKPR